MTTCFLGLTFTVDLYRVTRGGKTRDFTAVLGTPVFPLFSEADCARKPRLSVNILDKTLQPVRTVDLHLAGYMTVYLQRKRRGGMSQILLKRLDVHPALDARHSVGVPKIMHPGIWRTDLLCQPFKAVVNGSAGEIAAGGVCKHHSAVLPGQALLLSKTFLPLPLEGKQLGNAGSHGDVPLLSVFRRNNQILSAGFVLPLELLLYQNGLMRKVHTAPGKSKKLALPHPGEQCDLIQVLMGMPRKQLQKRFHLIGTEGVDFLLHHTRQHATVGWIGLQQAILNCLLERLVKDSVDILYRLGTDRLSVIHRGLMKNFWIMWPVSFSSFTVPRCGTI